MTDRSDVFAKPIAVAMRRTSLSCLPTTPVLPEPLTIRRARAQDSEALAALLGRAYPTETWDVPGTQHELFGDDTVKKTLVIAAEARLLATASLQVLPDTPECGWVRWVATEQSRRREGLARAVVISVLEAAVQVGCREAHLRTETDRMAAIALYLQLGFEPLVRNDPEREEWDHVLRFLRRNDSSAR
jgi:GNAT superfamily N-acetyltransferase